MSCSLRDAAALEARNIPVVVLANDVFRPIAYGTAELLGLERSYVEQNVVFFPHPTSNLTRDQIFALVDDAFESIATSLMGTGGVAAAVQPKGPSADALRTLLEPFRQSLREDGAELTVGELHDGVLQTRLDVDEAACADGTCVMPGSQLTAIIAAMLRGPFPEVHSVAMADSRERG